MNRLATIAALAGALLLPACGGSGMGQAVRQDITARMESVQSPLSECYRVALEEKRRLAGTMWLRFDVEPETGKFTNVQVARSQVRHEGLESCVVDEVSKLALETPQKTVVSVDYPIDFAPDQAAP
ncbi:MAG TPA: AgmX/PglI C-terminal domain-containing protein [Kofleriaceae bacterium]|nr:AgmX/PglI C-terminal domain-containing protein [Kofleriaceae bacterium]